MATSTASKPTTMFACLTERDCAYNGICNAASTCVCDPAWTGPRCETLRLAPARKDGGYRSPHAAGLTSSWGGSILHEDGTWHMFAAEMTNDCGIDYWEPNSRVVHATAPAADGPYTFESTVLAPFAHEPNAVRAPDGSWVIYTTLRHPPGELANCSSTKRHTREDRTSSVNLEMLAGKTASSAEPPPRHTYMVHARSPYGPWSAPTLVLRANESIWDNRSVYIDTNLAVAILPDNRVVGIWRKCENPPGTVCAQQCCTFPHLLTASDWREPSTYYAHSDRRLFPEVQPFGSEDPMLWLQPRPTAAGDGHADAPLVKGGASPPPPPPFIVHAILHDEQGPARCTAIGRHAFSDDGGASWVYAHDDAYNGTVHWAGGGRTDVYRRERPHMVVDGDGAPLYLSNGVQETTDDDRSWTLVQPLGAAPAAAAPKATGSCAFRPTRLRVNGLADPLGIQTRRPRLGWALEAATTPAVRNASQRAYRLEAFATEDAATPLWDSGVVPSSETLHVTWGGPPLRSSQRVYWRVASYDATPGGGGGALGAAPCAPSSLAWFEMALLDEAAWGGAAWLSRHAAKPNVSDCELYAPSERNKAPRFRAEVEVPPTAVGVRAYVAGLGYHRLYVDGERVGGSELDPGWSVVEKRVFYSVFDVSAQMLHHQHQHNGTAAARKHAVGIELGNGWWNPLPLRMWGHLNVRAALLNRPNGTREPMVRALLVAMHADGSAAPLLATAPGADGGWRCGGAPTTFNNLYLGERYDARLAEASRDWASVGYIAPSSWAAPVPAEDARAIGVLEALPMAPVRRQEALVARVLSDSRGGIGGGGGARDEGHGGARERTMLLLDVGRNIAGGCTWRVAGNSGDVVAMRYGELLNTDGTLNPMTSVAGQIKAPNAAAPCQPAVAYQADTLTLSGRADGDKWTSGAYSWHGFRYAEVTLPAGASLVGDVVCHPMRTDVSRVANFSSSSAALDRLRSLNRHTFDANLMSVQSDCPHRERFGYGGDPLGCGEAALSIYDFEAFYAKRVRDFNDARRLASASAASATSTAFASAASAAAPTIVGFPETAPYVGISDGGVGPPGSGPIGWQTYQPEAQLWMHKYYGELQLLHESFNTTLAYVRMLDQAPQQQLEGGLGDWMPAEGTSTAFTGLGFQRQSYLAFANISRLVGAPQLAAEYDAKAAAVARQMNGRFLNAASGVYNASASAGRTRRDTQCGQALALFSRLCPDPTACERALSVLEDNVLHASSHLPGACQGADTLPGCADAEGGAGPHLTAGLFGIKWVLMTLADGGSNDLAYSMLTSETYPSFGWMLRNPWANATTLWESWFFSDDTFSHDHPMFASSEVWLLQSVAGIQPHPAARGMDRVLIKPSPPSQLSWCNASFDTPRGRIAVAWRRAPIHAGSCDEFHLDVRIPPNVVATVHVPTAAVGGAMGGCGAAAPRELGGGLELARARRLEGRRGIGAALVVDVGSGDYSFVSHLVL